MEEGSKKEKREKSKTLIRRWTERDGWTEEGLRRIQRIRLTQKSMSTFSSQIKDTFRWEKKECRLCHLHNNLGFYHKTFREKYFTCQNKILTLTSHTKPLKSRKGSTTAVTFIQA